MKNSITKIILIIPILIAMSFGAIAQSQPNIAYDEEGNPYMKNEMIVKFHPALVNLAVIDDPNILIGTVEEFINPLALQALVDSGYFNEGLADLSIKKIYPWLNSSITTTETRIGTTIEMPKFWSAFLIYWDEYETGVSYSNALDSLNNLYPAVEYAERNYVGELHVLPNDPQFTAGNQAGLNPTALIPNANININPAWDLTVGRDNTRVGIFDSGINWDHDDFSEDNSNTFPKSRVKGGTDFINSTVISTNTTLDAHGHGSACAGIVGAIRNNELGLAGIAGGNGATNQWGVELFAMKISQNGNITHADAANAITQGSTSVGSGGFGLHVQNHSYGFSTSTNSLRDAVRFGYRNNCVLSISSGNDFDQTVNYPATYRDEWVLKVGANDASGDRASFSTFGNNLDFIAPGTGDIYATTDALSNTTYTFNDNGTSFAAPHATGLAALMCSYINAPSNAPNNLAPDDIENLMQRFATDITAAPATIGYDARTGFGRIDAGAVLQGIEMPRFEVRHYSQNFNNNTATKIASGVRINVSVWANGIAAGNYIGDVYRVTRTFNITPPSGRTILDVWSRNSSSTLYGNQPVIAEENCRVVSWNQTSATMEGYIFDIQTNIIGQGIFKWLPSQGLNGSGTMALTVYSDDPVATSVNDLPFDSDLARVIPNPSDGNFSLLFNLKSTEDLTIEVLDLTGKVIQTRSLGKTFAGHQNLSIDASQLNSGFYFCKLSTPKGSFTKKISIVR